MNGSEVDTIITEMDKIKMELAKAGVDISVFGDHLSAEKLEEMAGSIGAAKQLEAAMQQADLPVTEENIVDCNEAQQQAADLTMCSDEAVTNNRKSLYGTAQHWHSSSTASECRHGIR